MYTLKSIVFPSNVTWQYVCLGWFVSATGKGDIVLKEARHPCLEMQDDVAFIANSVALIRG